jgi:hypothetical protein
MKSSIVVASSILILSTVLLASAALSQQPTPTQPIPSQHPMPQQPLSQQPPLQQLPPQQLPSQQQSCGQMSGQYMHVTGTIDFISTNAPPQVIYYLRSEGRPCISDQFTIVDPRGPARCREGLKITAFGPLEITATGARVIDSNYTCH